MQLMKYVLVGFFLTVFLSIAKAEHRILTAPDGSTVTIYRDGYGVPHIEGESEAAVFFAQGFAAAEDRLYQMETYRRAALGRLAEVFGPAFVESDKDARSQGYTAAERAEMFALLAPEEQAIFTNYVAGVNVYLDSMAQNPPVYQPFEFQIFTALGLEIEDWTVDHSLAVTIFFMRIFGEAGGNELTRLTELQANGQAWFDENRPINDPDAPTTIPGGTAAPSRNWTYSGMQVDPAVIAAINDRQSAARQKRESLGIPPKFGSFAVQITPAKAANGNVLLLGCPQMGAPQPDEPNVVNEVELDCPTLHVGGMTVAGIPLVIIGHTEHHAWTFTSGASDNVDVYIDSTQDASYSKYYHNGEWLDFEVFEDTVVSSGTAVPFTYYRTVHGPVFGDDLSNHQVYSNQRTFWKAELDMARFVYQSVKAAGLAEFETALMVSSMSFNAFYIDSEQNVKFWHSGRYQDRSDGVDPRLPHKGDGTEEWGGFIDFADLPQAADPAQGYFVNWNNKPVAWWDNGDNVPWRGTTSQTVRVNLIDDFVTPIAAFTYENLKDVPFQISDHGTYQHAIEISATDIVDENIVPPGQSAFRNLAGVSSSHTSDQWQLHLDWMFKDQLFGENPPLGIEDEPATGSPQVLGLAQNYPNPFNPSTAIRYQLSVVSEVELVVYNLLGEKVRLLVRERQPAGSHTVTWDGTDDAGQVVASGVYLYRLRGGEQVKQRKMVLIR